MAQSLSEVARQVAMFTEAANAGRVRFNPDVGREMASVLGEMAYELERIRERAVRRSRVPNLGGHPESVILRERQGLVAAGDPQSFDTFLDGLRASVIEAKQAVETTIEVSERTDREAADGLGRAYE